MRGIEIFLVPAFPIQVAVHRKETRMLQVEVDIRIEHGIVAYLHPLIVLVLHCELPYGRTVIRCIIRGEVIHVNTQIGVEHPCDFKMDVQIGIDIQSRYGESVVIRGLLECQDVVPMQDPVLEILEELCRDKTHISTFLLHAYIVSGPGIVITLFDNIVRLHEIGVIPPVIIADPKLGLRLLDREIAHQSAGDDLVKVVIIPP